MKAYQGDDDEFLVNVIGKYQGERPILGEEPVMLDIELGRGMDGFQTLEALQARLPHLPVIMVSERSDPASIERALELGAFAYAPKPLDVANLEAHLAVALSRPDSRLR